MISDSAGLLVFAALPGALVLLRRWPLLLCAVSLAGAGWPFLLTELDPVLRGALTLLSLVFLIRCLQWGAGLEHPRGAWEFLLFLLLPILIRWEAPRAPDPRRTLLAFLRGVGLLGLAWLLRQGVLQLRPDHPIQLFTTQLGIYLALAGGFALGCVLLGLSGLDYVAPFDRPLASRTLAEFWGRRWNTWVSHLLHRHVFLPSGGRRHPIRGTLAAFGASAALHEWLVFGGSGRCSGWMGAFFLLQGLLVVLTSRSRMLRRLAKNAPVGSWLCTLVLLLVTGILVVRGAAGVDPSHAWNRYFAPGR